MGGVSKMTHPLFLVYELTSLRVNKLFVVIMICGIRVIRFRSLQQCGVISFEIRSLKKGHTESRRGRRVIKYKAMIGNRDAWSQADCLAIETSHGVTEGTEVKADNLTEVPKA
jgi:hypothetical protein